MLGVRRSVATELELRRRQRAVRIIAAESVVEVAVFHLVRGVFFDGISEHFGITLVLEAFGRKIIRKPGDKTEVLAPVGVIPLAVLFVVDGIVIAAETHLFVLRIEHYRSVEIPYRREVHKVVSRIRRVGNEYLVFDFVLLAARPEREHRDGIVVKHIVRRHDRRDRYAGGYKHHRDDQPGYKEHARSAALFRVFRFGHLRRTIFPAAKLFSSAGSHPAHIVVLFHSTDISFPRRYASTPHGETNVSETARSICPPTPYFLFAAKSPYFPSPSTGIPAAASCTRSW